MNRSLPQLRSRQRGSQVNNPVLRPHNRRSAPLKRLQGHYRRVRTSCRLYFPWLIGSCIVLVILPCHVYCFYQLMLKNLMGADFQVELKHNLVDRATGCPALAVRFTHFHSKPFVPMTHEELQQQIALMIPVPNHTSRNLILHCPTSEQVEDGAPTCRGIVKVFRSETLYHHVKRCLMILEDSMITARILHADDETLTLVEEELGSATLWDAPIPRDFDVQLLYIRCILLKHSIVHRDFTSANFVVHPNTGKLFVIDFSDAFIWDNEWISPRNLINLFNIWWKWHDEDAQRHELVTLTKPRWVGDMRWKHPVQPEQHEKWVPSEEDLKLMGDHPRFHILEDNNN